MTGPPAPVPAGPLGSATSAMATGFPISIGHAVPIVAILHFIPSRGGVYFTQTGLGKGPVEVIVHVRLLGLSFFRCRPGGKAFSQRRKGGHYGFLDSPRPSITVPSRNRPNVFSRPLLPVQISGDRCRVAHRSPVHFGATGTGRSLGLSGRLLRPQWWKFLTIGRPVVTRTIVPAYMPILLILAGTPTRVSGALISGGPRG